MNVLFLYIYLAAAFAIGCLSIRRIRTAADYYVAGRRTGAFHVAGSLLATILGSSAILGSIDFAFDKGWAGAWFMLCAAFGLLMLLLFTKPLVAFKGYNLPTLLGGFYGDTVKKLSAGVIAIAWLGVVAAQIIGAAKITTAVFNISYMHAVLAIGLTMTFYTAAGGQFSILHTDAFQLVFILIGVWLAAAVLFVKDPSVAAAPMISEQFTPVDLLVMLFTYSSTYIVGPDIYSRLFCAKDERTVHRAIVATAAILIPTAFLLAFIGIHGARFYAKGDGSVFFVIARNEFPCAVTCLLYFSMLSAIMSSADTTLFTAGGLLSQFIHDNMDSRKSIRLTMGCTLLLGLLSILVALKFTSILSVLLFSLGVYAGAFVVPSIWGLLGQRSRCGYVVAAIIAGGGMSLAGKGVGGGVGGALSILAFVVNLAILWLGRVKEQVVS